jgi:hypothetical protein
VQENLERGRPFFFDQRLQAAEEFAVGKTGERCARHGVPPFTTYPGLIPSVSGMITTTTPGGGTLTTGI